ncbi:MULTISPECIES: vWA domain-containing protein [Bacteroides]|uniref:VWFA domain-containing protein n=2 Tax=Bacteroides TaxID=816 RepID=I9T0R9_9BACE|nr:MULTISPECIES: VWA domain-containing protein [Bacteroides]EIY62173.1 hypothetical protein HMPREF1071_02793 [Bacteroides salyersiae CL02T12C01]UBD15067.1 VWA domain-containing protein [Bacteroides salyersiae]UYU44882.1 VWA domain-containing protein [Bacteroides salyersiae]CCY51234.1 uncharacterized protein BN523_03191 [Bacteroides sp. CAG:189]
MSYSIQWGQKSPGHIIFLIDQSGSMCGSNEVKAAEAVHQAIEEIINNCINGTKVKNRVYITIIGYGNEHDVCILKEGWATDYVADLQQCKVSGSLIIEPDSYGGTPMAEGFDKAKDCLEKWLNDRSAAGTDIPAPIVINITDGMPNDEDDATASAHEIMNMTTPDGNVILFNIHMDEDGREIRFPRSISQTGGSDEAAFLFNISSEMNDQFIRVAHSKGFEGVSRGAKGFIANANGDTLVRFIEFGSSVSSMAMTPR